MLNGELEAVANAGYAIRRGVAREPLDWQAPLESADS